MCIWSSVFIVQKESVKIIVLLKCGEIKLFNNILLHILKCIDLFIQNKKNNFALYVLHRWTVLFINYVLFKWHQIDVHTIHFPFKSQFFFIPFIICNFLQEKLHIQITVESFCTHIRKLIAVGCFYK